MALKEYKKGQAFPGVVGRTVGESQPAWPQPLRTGPGAPNVIFIVLDDVGFGQIGCFGGPVHTPHLDKLAAGGLRYSRMHTTALCSPSRSCILTGRNHHANNLGGITEIATGFPGYHGHIPFENGLLSEILQQNGYSTYCAGKWHLTPAEQTSQAGPFDRWPLGRGFERFYGFLGGDTHQYYPDLIYDNHQVAPPAKPDQGYHLTADLVDRSIAFLSDSKQVAPDKPFFLYLATGACHAPHQVPKPWADRYKGKFDDGWDAARENILKRQIDMGLFPKGTKLSRHDPDVAHWKKLPAEERKLYARMMEVFAGFLEHTDHQFGRLFEFLTKHKWLDNTLIMVVSDNGASAEGGPTGSVNENKFFNNVPDSLQENLAAIDELGGPKHFNHYPWGWTFAGNTPFRRWKRETYRGGTADPFIVHWPKGIQAQGEVRSQYAHLIDIVPTVLECLQIEPPEHIRGVTQSPLHGVSFARSFDDANAPSRHITQYFEMFGHRSIDHDGWRAVCPVPGPSFAEAGIGFGEMTLTEAKLRELDAKAWEIYHVAEDPTETTDLAGKHRDKLIEMIARWYVEAGKYNVLPIDSRGALRFAEQRPQLTPARKRYIYLPATSAVPENVAANVLNRPHSITAEVEIPPGGAAGVLLAHGGNSGGYSFFIQDKKLHYVQNYVGTRALHVESEVEVPEGKVTLRFEFEPTGEPDIAHGKGSPGRGQLSIDGKLAGQAQFPVTVPVIIGITEGLVCGRDPGSAVTDRYEAPFAFTGAIDHVTVDVSGELIEDAEATVRAAMAHQ